MFKLGTVTPFTHAYNQFPSICSTVYYNFFWCALIQRVHKALTVYPRWRDWSLAPLPFRRANTAQRCQHLLGLRSWTFPTCSEVPSTRLPAALPLPWCSSLSAVWGRSAVAPELGALQSGETSLAGHNPLTFTDAEDAEEDSWEQYKGHIISDQRSVWLRIPSPAMLKSRCSSGGQARLKLPAARSPSTWPESGLSSKKDVKLLTSHWFQQFQAGFASFEFSRESETSIERKNCGYRLCFWKILHCCLWKNKIHLPSPPYSDYKLPFFSSCNIWKYLQLEFIE